MTVWIHRIDTALPATSYSQEEARERVKSQMPDRRSRLVVHQLYNQSGIERRYSVVPDFGSPEPQALFRSGPDGRWIEPGTGARNTCYGEASRELAVALARKTMDATPALAAGDITHIVTASCTGFSNPGIDYHVVRALDLPQGTQRYHLGFMGCYAAMPALRMARQFCEADPRAVVLVLCLELCSLHLQLDPGNLNGLLASALFSDGAAAAVVSRRPPPAGSRAYALRGDASALAPGGEKDMAWTIGDKGFDIVLSGYVPDILGANIRGLVEPLVAASGSDLDRVGAWAVHPGGRAILDRVGEALELEPDALAASRAVLRNFGNMSSATVLFVLKRLLEEPEQALGCTCAMAFGPGLTVEMALMDAVDVPARRPNPEMGAERLSCS